MHPSSWSVRRATMAALFVAGCVPGEDTTGPGGGRGGAGGAGPAVTGGRAGGDPGGSGGGGANPGSGGGGTAPGAGGQGGSPAGGTGGTSGSGGGAPGGTGGGGGAQSDAAIKPPDSGAGGGEMGGSGSKPFSFFVTSIEAMRKQSKSQNGFGGNLGGLTGADGICQAIAAEQGAGDKTWRAFLSATKGGPDGGPVHAIDRIGEGPWYDFNGRLIARNKADLVMVRPAGDPQATSDLPNEKGLAQKQFGDNHDTLTGSNQMGRLQNTNPGSTCQDWTNASPTGNSPIMCGHSWSRVGRQPWIQEHTVPGCAPGVNLRDNTVMPGNCVGCNGGYGGIYCFALTP
jgi:hypothetical protein